MQQVTLNIPDNKLSFFMELIHSLDFVQLDKNAGTIILSDEQKRLINKEREKANDDAGYMLDWAEVRSSLNLD